MLMDVIPQLYRRLDDWVWGLSRRAYAILTGLTAGLGSLLVSVAFGDPDLVFAVGIGLGLTLLYYWSDPNQRAE